MLQQDGSLAVGDVIQCRVLDADLLALAAHLQHALAGLCAQQAAAHGVRRVGIQRGIGDAQFLVVASAVEVEDAAWCRAVELQDAVLHRNLAEQVVLAVAVDEAVLQTRNLHVLDADGTDLKGTLVVQVGILRYGTHQDELVGIT